MAACPMGAPGWPELAFWIASMESVRVVFTQVWSMSFVATGSSWGALLAGVIWVLHETWAAEPEPEPVAVAAAETPAKRRPAKARASRSAMSTSRR